MVIWLLEFEGAGYQIGLIANAASLSRKPVKRSA
jgi:hypothetical protein